jgi:NAD+ diphosphatase
VAEASFLPLLEPAGEGEPLLFAVQGSRVAVRDGEGEVFLGTLGGRPCWASPCDAGDDLLDLRQLWGRLDETTWTVAGRAVQLVDWARTSRYCGACGEETEDVAGERARKCPSCSLLLFPRLAPAVITLVERDEDGRALLARGAQFPLPMYSCLAGFVEPGETLEQAVVREVREEVGIEVGDVRYWGSQPWPFPHSLMIGFSARWVSGDLVLDEREIADAGWYAADELPMVPPGMSIARRIIDDWVERTTA